MAPGATTALRADKRSAQCAAVQAGLGIAVLAHHLAAGLALVRLPAPPLPEREIWLVQHRDTRDTPRIRAVADTIAAGLRAARPLFAGQLPASPHSG
jgi:DNA-binding transcriptional LysR family regulator